MTDPKPLNWTSEPGIGYTVIRRGDGIGNNSPARIETAEVYRWP